MDHGVFEAWLDGVFLARLGVDGRCTEFREWWHKQEERAS